MTPAINAAKKSRVAHAIHKYAHDPRNPAYGLEAAQALGLDPTEVFKTLVVEVDGQQLGVAVVPVQCQLDLKRLAAAAGGKRAEMADPKKAERITGYIRGGISPIGQKRALPTYIDESAQALSRMFVSAGRRGLEIELAPADLGALTAATFAALGKVD